MLTFRSVAALLFIHTIVSTGLSETHRFEPKVFYNTFSGAHPPALRIKPGDSVNTYTIDAGGKDAAGAQRGRVPILKRDLFISKVRSPATRLSSVCCASRPTAARVTRVRFWRRTASIRVFCGRKRCGRQSS